MKYFYGLTLRAMCLRGYTCSLRVMRQRDEESVFAITCYFIGASKQDRCVIHVGKTKVKFEYIFVDWETGEESTYIHITEPEDIRSHNVDDLVITMKRVGLMATLVSHNQQLRFTAMGDINND